MPLRLRYSDVLTRKEPSRQIMDLQLITELRLDQRPVPIMNYCAKLIEKGDLMSCSGKFARRCFSGDRTSGIRPLDRSVMNSYVSGWLSSVLFGQRLHNHGYEASSVVIRISM